MSQIIDETGNKYGRLLVKACFSKDGRTRWLCVCDCGKEIVCYASNVSSGKSKSCGCLSKETNAARQHIHGETDTQTYKVWCWIKARCFNPKVESYIRYGGAGITMSPLWKDNYIAFRDYIGHPPEDGQKYSVDRIDNSKGYEPGNVRWATQEQQTRNKGMYKNNTTGVAGVRFDGHRYVAAWRTLEGKRKSVGFNITKYGKEEAFRLACEARENAIKELNAQGAGYSENHGK